MNDVTNLPRKYQRAAKNNYSIARSFVTLINFSDVSYREKIRASRRAISLQKMAAQQSLTDRILRGVE